MQIISSIVPNEEGQRKEAFAKYGNVHVDDTLVPSDPGHVQP